MKNIQNTLKAFSIIEVMVGIFIFSLGLISIYALLVSSLKVSDYNKNAIIAGNLAREQIELVRNVRDTNYKNLRIWKQMNPNDSYSVSTEMLNNSQTSSGSYYIVENDFSPSATFPTSFQDISSTFIEGESNLNSAGMKQYQLCEEIATGRYVDCPNVITSAYKETYFYRFIQLPPNYDDGTPLLDSFMIVSKVIWFKRGYHEFEIKTIITDWRRI